VARGYRDTLEDAAHARVAVVNAQADACFRDASNPINELIFLLYFPVSDIFFKTPEKTRRSLRVR
jgi:hypothetical protein